MLVKAKWNVKDAFGWHRAGEIWNTDKDLGDAVEVLDAPKAEPKQETVKETELVATEAKEPAKARTSARRKTTK